MKNAFAPIRAIRRTSGNGAPRWLMRSVQSIFGQAVKNNFRLECSDITHTHTQAALLQFRCYAIRFTWAPRSDISARQTRLLGQNWRCFYCILVAICCVMSKALIFVFFLLLLFVLVFFVRKSWLALFDFRQYTKLNSGHLEEAIGANDSIQYHRRWLIGRRRAIITIIVRPARLCVRREALAVALNSIVR